MVKEPQYETKKVTSSKWWRILLVVAILATAISFAVISHPPVAHATPQYNTCAYTLTPVDMAPGNWWTEHQKFLFAYGTSQDLTQLFLSGQLIISYSDQNYNILGTADRNTWWIGVQSLNQWGLSTRWTWFNPNFTSYHWLALWNC